jgi:syntaxin 16
MLCEATQSIGISRAKTSLLEEFRRQKAEKSTRFKKQKTMASSYSTTTNLLDDSVELSTALVPGLDSTPEFILLFKKASARLLELDVILMDLNKQTSIKMTNQFSERMNNDQKIHELTDQAVRIVHESEMDLNKINAMEVRDTEGHIKKNIQRSLAKKVQEAAKKIRVEEQNLYHSMQKLKGSGGQFDAILNDNGARKEIIEDEEGNQYEMEILERVSMEREEEINHVVKAIHDLATLFKSMNELIIEQGTIVDQIDHNIQETQKQISSGNKHLLKVKTISLWG